MLSIDQYAYTNRLKNVHPLEKFILAITVLIICLTANSIIISLLTLILMATMAVSQAKIPGSYFARLLLAPLVFLSLSMLTIVISVGGVPSDYWQVLTIGTVVMGIRSPDLLLAGNLFFKSLGAVSCLYFLALTTPMVDLLWVLKKLKAPGLFLELMGLMYRFIFVLLETAAKMQTSQATRLGYATFKSSYNSLGSLLANLFGKSYHKSRELTVAMLARGYTDTILVLDNEYVFSKRNLVLIILTDVLLAALAVYFGGGLAWPI